MYIPVLHTSVKSLFIFSKNEINVLENISKHLKTMTFF